MGIQMTNNIKNAILSFMEKNRDIEYSIPDFQKGLKIKNREHLIRALTELEKDVKVISREKGATRLYRLAN
jgi:exoribonuclease R